MKAASWMCALSSLLSVAAAASSPQSPAPASSSDSRGHAEASSGGVKALLLVTSDRDWKQKWDTSPDTIPQFTAATSVVDGGELAVLTFVTGPGLNAANRTEVDCDLRVTRPDGTFSIDHHDLPCFHTELRAHPDNTFLTQAGFSFVAETKDLRGNWKIDVTVKDRVRNVQLPLSTSFVLK